MVRRENSPGGGEGEELRALAGTVDRRDFEERNCYGGINLFAWVCQHLSLCVTFVPLINDKLLSEAFL